MAASTVPETVSAQKYAHRRQKTTTLDEHCEQRERENGGGEVNYTYIYREICTHNMLPHLITIHTAHTYIQREREREDRYIYIYTPTVSTMDSVQKKSASLRFNQLAHAQQHRRNEGCSTGADQEIKV